MRLIHFPVATLCALLLAPGINAQVTTVGTTVAPARLSSPMTLPAGAAPQGLAATPSSPTSVRLTWAPVTGATGYSVERGKSADGSFTTIATVPPPLAEVSTAVDGRRSLRVAPAMTAVPPVAYLDAGVLPNSTAYYRVAATYDGQNPGTSGAVSATTPLAPQPTGFTAVAGPGSVTLSWNPAPGASSYMVSRDNSVFLNNQQHILDTTYTDDGLPIKTYTYRLIAYYTVQGVGEAEGDLTQVPIAVATPRAAAPKDFRVDTYGGGTTLDFNWTPVPGATGYTVLRALASDGNFAEVPKMEYADRGDAAKSGPSGGLAEWARDYTVQIGETYLYKLLAYYADMPPGESQVLRVEVKPKPPGVGNLTGSSPQPGTVVLHWTPPPGAKGYCILRGKDKEPTMVGLTRCEPYFDLPGTASSYTDKNLWNGATYRYTVSTSYGDKLYGVNAGVDVKVGP
jgi:hypothetical protein